MGCDYRAVRKLAEVDSALAHVFAFHQLQLASVRLFGSDAQQQRLFEETLAHNLFWGNALNPLDKRTLAWETPGGFVLQGETSYCSGSVGSDCLLVSGWHEASQSLVIAALPTGRAGIRVQADWDVFGKRQTDSGTAVSAGLTFSVVDLASPAASDARAAFESGGLPARFIRAR
jgi:alkylation response protein AidB-like acyl-CoA dehydrogenase